MTPITAFNFINMFQLRFVVVGEQPAVIVDVDQVRSLQSRDEGVDGRGDGGLLAAQEQQRRWRRQPGHQLLRRSKSVASVVPEISQSHSRCEDVVVVVVFVGVVVVVVVVVFI